MTPLLIGILMFDLFRFGWKYIPFVPERIVYPSTPVTDWIQEKGKTEVFRIEREKGEMMPPATWMAYRFMSASGYDPMALSDYVQSYLKVINGNNSGMISRYSEPERYNAEALGMFNVKYLLAIKRDKIARIPGDQINYMIDRKEWTKVYETGSSAIFENTKYQARARFTDGKGIVTISKYTPNEVVLKYKDGLNKTLLLVDTWYPGWEATLNSKKITIEKCESIFRCIKTDTDSGEVVYSFKPKSFYYGAIISLVSLALTLVGLVWYWRKRQG